MKVDAKSRFFWSVQHLPLDHESALPFPAYQLILSDQQELHSAHGTAKQRHKTQMCRIRNIDHNKATIEVTWGAHSNGKHSHL